LLSCLDWFDFCYPPETDWKDEDDEMKEDQIPVEPPSATVTSLISVALPTGNENDEI
jgi:hypothetical protein